MPVDELIARTATVSASRYEAVGVVATKTPSNYPFAVALIKIVPALAVGCCVVLRPSPVTLFTTATIAFAAARVGIPPGVLSFVVEAGAQVPSDSHAIQMSTCRKSFVKVPPP